MYAPYKYSEINVANTLYEPSIVKNRNNAHYNYWFRSLFQRASSVIVFDGLPWKGSVKQFMYYCLFKYGYIDCFNDENFGKAFQPCTLSGMDFYYQPTDAIVSNPDLNVTHRIHEDCGILKLTPDYRGIWDVIDYYACMLAEFNPAIMMSVISAKYATIMGAETKAGARFLEKVVDKVNAGNPAIVFDASILVPKNPATKEDTIHDYSRKDIKSTYIGTELINDFMSILNQFDSEVGIPTIPYQKKERMVTDEATSRTIDSQARSLIWIESLNDSLDEDVNRILDSNIKARHRYANMIGGEDDGQYQNTATGTI